MADCGTGFGPRRFGRVPHPANAPADEGALEAWVRRTLPFSILPAIIASYPALPPSPSPYRKDAASQAGQRGRRARGRACRCAKPRREPCAKGSLTTRSRRRPDCTPPRKARPCAPTESPNALRPHPYRAMRSRASRFLRTPPTTAAIRCSGMLGFFERMACTASGKSASVLMSSQPKCPSNRRT